jgi:hypothetical protein
MGHFYVLRNFLESDRRFPRFSIYQAHIDAQLPVELNDIRAVWHRGDPVASGELAAI